MITEIVILIVIGVITFVIYITYRNRQGSFTDHGTTVRTQDAVEVDPCEHSASESEHSAEVDPRHHNEPLVSESDLSAEVDGRQHKESVVSKSDLSAELDPCHQEESTESKSNLSAELDPCHQEESPESKSDLSAELDPCHQEESPKSKSDLSAELDPCHQEESPESKSDLSVELDPCYQDELPESKSDLSVELDIKSKVPTHEPSQQMSAKTEDSGVTIADDDDLPSSECTRASAAANIVNLPTADAIKKPPQLDNTSKTKPQQAIRAPKTESERFSNMKHLAEYKISTLNPEMYVITRAYSKAEDQLRDLGVVVLVGNPGSGKTTLGLHLMAHIRDLRNRQVLLLEHPSQFEDVRIPNNFMFATEKDKLVILIDDIFGRSNLLDEYVHKWELNFPKLWDLVKTGFMKVIITCRSQIFGECESSLKEFDIFKICHQINLLGPDFCLTTEEKRHILDQHLKTSINLNNTLSEYQKDWAAQLTFTELGFPQCCRFYVNSPEAQKRGLAYFGNPIEYLKGQLAKMKLDKECQFQYLVLLILLFKQGTLHEDCLDPFEEESVDIINMIKLLKEVCKINTDVSLGQIKASAKSICGVYLEYNDCYKTYSFVHQSVFDTLFLQFSGEFLKQSINICPVSMLIEYVVTPRVTARGAVNIVVESKHYRFLAQRFTAELKGSEPLVKKCRSKSSMRTSLSHPSFKDNDFVKFLTEEFWNNEVPSEILYRKLDAFEISTDVLANVDTAWINVQNRDIDDIDHSDIRNFFPSIRCAITIATVTSQVSLAVFMKLKSLSSHLVFSLCKSDSSEIELQGKEILDVACFVGNAEVVDVLLESGIAPTMSSFTASAASQIDEVDIFVNLLKHKKDLELSLHDLGSVLFLALEKENGNISSMLIDEITKMDNSQIILEMAVKQLLVQCYRGVKYLKNLMDTSKPKSSSKLGAGNLFRKLFNYTVSLKPEVVVSLAAAHDDAAVLNEIRQINPPWWNIVKGNETLLHIASCYGCVESVTFLIGEGCRVSTVNPKHQTALHLAAKYGTPDVVLCLISKGADPNAQDINGDTPLHLAGCNGSLDIVKALTERGARLNAQHTDGKTPLHIASQDKAITVYLQEKGAEINIHNNNGRIPLHEAVKCNSADCVKYLVEKGSKVNLADANGITPLLLASSGGMASYLLRNGADPFVTDVEGNSALHLAVSMSSNADSLALVELLIEKGVKVNSINRQGEIPLHIAAGKNSLQIVRYLVEQGSEINLLNGKGMSPLYRTVWVIEGPFHVSLYLLHKGADPNLIGQGRVPLLHLALFNASLEFTKALVQKKANLTRADIYGMMPLHATIKYKNSLEFVKCLVENGSNVNIKNKGSTPLHVAITVKSFDVCLYLLDKGADPNATDAEQNSPLHLAVEVNSLHLVEALIERGANLNAVNAVASSPLHLAVRKDNLVLVKQLVEKGAKLNVVDSSGNTPLHSAAQYSSVVMVRYLVEKGLQIDLPNGTGMTPIHLAARHNECEVCVYLLDRGADPNVTDADSKSPLHFAACNTHLDIVETLVQHGAKVNDLDKFEYTPLYIAAKGGSLKTVSYLIERGHQIKPANDYIMMLFNLAVEYNTEDVCVYLLAKASNPTLVGNTEMDSLIHIAARRCWLSLIKALIESGANVNEVDRCGRTPLLSMLQYYSEDIWKRPDPLECMVCLIDQGAELNTKDNEGRIPLHIAAAFCYPEFVKCLVRSGSDINIKDNNGSTPLHKAQTQPIRDQSLYLLKHGADPNVKDTENVYPLHIAAENCELSFLKALVEKGANLKITDSDGNTPLHLTVDGHSIECVKYLVGKGCVVNAANKKGNTPLHNAAKLRNSNIGLYLLTKGADPNVTNTENMSPLHSAATTEHSDFVYALVMNGAKLNAVDITGETALHKAVCCTRFKTVRCLVEKGSDINLANASGKTPLDLAEGADLSNIRGYLLAKGPSHAKDMCTPTQQ